MPLAHAQQHVELEVNPKQEDSLEIGHALVVTQTHNHALVRFSVINDPTFMMQIENRLSHKFVFLPFLT